MKGLIKIAVIASFVSLSFFNIANAKSHHDNHMWMCETNASSSASDSEKNADDKMSKKAMSAKDAFNYAMKHCRDCTKITCTQESK